MTEQEAFRFLEALLVDHRQVQIGHDRIGDERYFQIRCYHAFCSPNRNTGWYNTAAKTLVEAVVLLKTQLDIEGDGMSDGSLLRMLEASQERYDALVAENRELRRRVDNLEDEGNSRCLPKLSGRKSHGTP